MPIFTLTLPALSFHTKLSVPDKSKVTRSGLQVFAVQEAPEDGSFHDICAAAAQMRLFDMRHSALQVTESAVPLHPGRLFRARPCRTSPPAMSCPARSRARPPDAVPDLQTSFYRICSLRWCRAVCRALPGEA